MSKIDLSQLEREKPMIQMAPLIDIVFITMIFFMTLSVFAQFESEINISVPKARQQKETVRSPGEVIVNITKSGEFIVNQKSMDLDGLEEMLKKVSGLFPDQPVIIRADEETYHKYIVNVLDVCAKSNIWDISFATTSGGQ